MKSIRACAAALSWLGRQGTRAVAALVLIGIALPWIGALLKPYVTEAVFLLLCTAFLRVDIAALETCLRHPAVALAQFPIYLSPYCFNRLRERSSTSP